MHPRAESLLEPFQGSRALDVAVVHDPRRAVALAQPGGAVLFAPDYVRENFPGASTDDGCRDDPRPAGGDELCAHGLRFVEWVWDPDPENTEYVVDYAFLRPGGRRWWGLRFQAAARAAVVEHVTAHSGGRRRRT